MRKGDPADLDWTAEEMRQLGHEVLERCVQHLASLREQPSRGDVGDTHAIASARHALPSDGVPLTPLLDRLFEEWIPKSFTTPGPGYFAYVPGGGLFPSALASLISETTNRFVGVWQAAPALAELEGTVLDWIRDWMQFPTSARGLLTPGSSISTLIAITAAREKLLGTEIRRGVAYVSRQTHHCVMKSARLAGIANDRVRVLPVDSQFRMCVDSLREAVRADRAKGLVPFLVISTAGSVNVGAVDDLDAVADAATELGLWHHIDAAYGGFFHVVPALRPLLSGLPRADSIALDPHKGLFLPYGTGALLVRDGGDLRAVHAADADYLPETPDSDYYDIASYGPELSRPFRGLRLWLPLMLAGSDRLRSAIAEKRELALVAHEAVRSLPHVRVLLPPCLSLFAFRVERPGCSEEENDATTRALVEGTTRRGRVMISGCGEGGRSWGRVCVLSFRSRRAEVDMLIEDLTATLSEL